MRIGLLSGTFNPIHNGHLQIAGEVFQRLRLDTVLFIPSGIPPHKSGQKIPPAKYRMEMASLALSGNPRFELCKLEVDRPGKSYSIDTVRALKKLYPKDRLFFILGMDAFLDIASWRDADHLLGLCDFVLISRPGSPFSQLPDIAALRSVDLKPFSQLDKGDRRSYTFPVSEGSALHFLQVRPSPISASEIRRRFAARQETKNLLPEQVESYIIKEQIYVENNNL
ncbi:MAG: nicotinate-nucleotide adenylyltransferase [Nitrospira sp.]|nr:nicotinate-nucleotide adenylyltransferase [Candidatus Manganitrophaceae bacterium]HIL35202.1 nicotinate-nucleotide adenylyltransferase [Candidatus Manganitrophaceae bacterium]